jgi:hypothetical protein
MGSKMRRLVTNFLPCRHWSWSYRKVVLIYAAAAGHAKTVARNSTPLPMRVCMWPSQSELRKKASQLASKQEAATTMSKGAIARRGVGIPQYPSFVQRSQL